MSYNYMISAQKEANTKSVLSYIQACHTSIINYTGTFHLKPRIGRSITASLPHFLK